MRICRFKCKPGVIITLAICIGLVASRNQLPSLIWTAAVWLQGKPNHCSFYQSLQSFENIQAQERIQKEVRLSTRVVARDSKWDIELYRIGSETIWAPSNNVADLAAILGEQGRGLYDGRAAHVQKGDVVLDVGAHVGIFTRHALRMGAARVIAVEPSPQNLECLKRNLQQEIYAGRVVVISKGLWNKDDSLKMNIRRNGGGGDSLIWKPEAGDSSVMVPLVTADHMVQELGLSRIDFVKMDTEGAEREILSGASGILSRFKPRMAICVYHLPDDTRVLPAIIKRARPDYRQSCGQCEFQENRLFPRVFFFY